MANRRRSRHAGSPTSSCVRRTPNRPASTPHPVSAGAGGGVGVGDHPRCPARGTGSAAAQTLPDDHRCPSLIGGGGDQRVHPPDPRISVTGSLLGVPVHRHDRGGTALHEVLGGASRSTNTRPAGSGPSTSGVRSAKPHRKRVATASSWRTCPEVNDRKNEPSVDGAYGRSKTVGMAPCRNAAMSSMCRRRRPSRPPVRTPSGPQSSPYRSAPTHARLPGQRAHFPGPTPTPESGRPRRGDCGQRRGGYRPGIG